MIEIRPEEIASVLRTRLESGIRGINDGLCPECGLTPDSLFISRVWMLRGAYDPGLPTRFHLDVRYNHETGRGCVFHDWTATVDVENAELEDLGRRARFDSNSWWAQRERERTQREREERQAELRPSADDEEERRLIMAVVREQNGTTRFHQALAALRSYRQERARHLRALEQQRYNAVPYEDAARALYWRGRAENARPAGAGIAPMRSITGASTAPAFQPYDAEMLRRQAEMDRWNAEIDRCNRERLERSRGGWFQRPLYDVALPSQMDVPIYEALERWSRETPVGRKAAAPNVAPAKPAVLPPTGKRLIDLDDD